MSNHDIVVDWDGQNDPYNPTNWSYKRKWAATIVVSSFTFISPVSSSMIAPASEQVARQFGVTDSVIIAMMTSVFVLAYALGPLLLGPLSEIYGRSHVIQLANLFFLVWNIACGFAKNETQLIVFRFLAGLGGSAPLAIGGAVIGDCWSKEERGRAIAIYSLAPLIGPVLGPIAGSWIAEKSIWQWVFWSTSIVDAVIQVFGLFFLQETFPPVLLERKKKKLIRKMDNEKGTIVHIRTVYENEDRHWKRIFAKAMSRPFAMLAREPIIQVIALYMAFTYGLFYIFLTTMPFIFGGVYSERPGIAGLHYLSLGVGLTGVAQINARMMDPIYVYLKEKRGGGVGRPEFRLPPMAVGTVLLPIGLLLAGWGPEKGVHWIVADIGIALIGSGAILIFQCMQTYVIDMYTLHAASALAAATCFRSLAGFGFPLFAPTMYDKLGYGKGNTILAVVGGVIGCPAPWVLWYFGERIRRASRYAR